MNNLLDPASNNSIIERIDRLGPTAQPKWGKMNVAQMLAHCQVPIEISLNQKKLKQSLMGLLFGKMVKKRIMNDVPFRKNLPTDRSFIVVDERKFEEEKKKLIDLLKKLSNVGPDGLTKGPHPFFGRMTPEEWGILGWKHLDHHLRQFGV